MFKFSDSFMNAIKSVITEAVPEDHKHIQSLSGYSGGQNGKAILSFETHHGTLLSNKEFGNQDHKKALVSDLDHAHALAHANSPEDKPAIIAVKKWASAPHRKVGDKYGVNK